MPRNDNNTTKQGWWRVQSHLGEFNSPSYPLDESQPLRRLHKAFGTQCPKTAEALAEHIRFNTLFYEDFLGLKHVVLMWWWFCACGAALGAYASRIRRKQHRWVNSALDRPHHGRLRCKGIKHSLHLAQCLRGTEVDFIQEYEIG
jgi:hypothetical protein